MGHPQVPMWNDVSGETCELPAKPTLEAGTLVDAG